jgi:hypothetical protein
MLIATELCVGALTAFASTHTSATLGPNGIGRVLFGLPKARAVVELSTLFGSPTWVSASDGCGPRYSEVEWGDLAAEFRLNEFSGYRYATRSYLQRSVGAPRGSLNVVSPPLATANGITLGSTLAQLRAAYKVLHWGGPGKRLASNGLRFFDPAMRSPAPLASRVIEIKIGTCGDY